LDTALREQMLASATDAVNALCAFAHDQPLAEFDAREERVPSSLVAAFPKAHTSGDSTLGGLLSRGPVPLFGCAAWTRQIGRRGWPHASRDCLLAPY